MNLKTEELIKDHNCLNAGLVRVYILSFVVALISIGLISYCFHLSNHMNKTYAPLINAAMEIQMEVTKVHLWVEEIVSGDQYEDLTVVWKHLRKADWYARAMLEGGENEHGKYIPLDNQRMKDDVMSIRNKMEEFRAIIKQRIQAKETSVAGSDIDQHFDVIFNELIEETETVETKLKNMMVSEFSSQQSAQKELIAACLLLFVILGLIYLRFNRQRSVVLQILRDSKEKIEKEMEERKEAEGEIQIQNEAMQKRLLEIAELRDLDEERLADLNLANEQLRIAIDESDADNRDKSEFFAGMTHEMRTPANAIIDLTYITLDTHLDDEQRGEINTIKESAYSILSLLDSYMDILKIESGNLELQRTEFNIQNMLDSIIMTLSPQAHKKDIDLQCQIDPNVVPDIIGDKGRLWQILIHLIGNAIKFTVDGKIEIGVKRVFFGGESNKDKTDSEPKQVLLRFSVCDTGVGIPEDKLVGIFEHFNSTENPAIKEFGETRLGLHVSNKLVHMMGGEIWVESNEGEGSSFCFTTMFDLVSESEKHGPLSDAALDETGSSTHAGVEYNNPGELPTT